MKMNLLAELILISLRFHTRLVLMQRQKATISIFKNKCSTHAILSLPNTEGSKRHEG